MLYRRLALPENIRLGQKCMVEPELVKLQVSLTHWICAQIVFLADFAGQVSISPKFYEQLFCMKVFAQLLWAYNLGL